MMEIDIPAQARALSTIFFDFSISVDKFRMDHAAELTETQRSVLVTQATHLDDFSDHFTAAAIGATLRSIQDDLDTILTVTKEAKDAVKTIGKIEKVSSIVSSGVALGAAIFAGNLATIGSATQALFEAVSGKPAVQSA